MKQPELASFVPSLVARRLLERPDPPSTPEVERFDDISGFTGLAERLAQTGPSGVEALSELLNGCFGELVQLVATHGGDVVKFAGDALLALWRADADLAAATARSAACGLALQGFLDATELAEDARLTMRVGIGAGQVSAAHLGGELGRWEFVVGRTLRGHGITRRIARVGVESSTDRGSGPAWCGRLRRFGPPRPRTGSAGREGKADSSFL